MKRRPHFLARCWHRIRIQAAMRHQQSLVDDLDNRLCEAMFSLPAQRDVARDRIKTLRAELARYA